MKVKSRQKNNSQARTSTDAWKINFYSNKVFVIPTSAANLNIGMKLNKINYLQRPQLIWLIFFIKSHHQRLSSPVLSCRLLSERTVETQWAALIVGLPPLHPCSNRLQGETHSGSRVVTPFTSFTTIINPFAHQILTHAQMFHVRSLSTSRAPHIIDPIMKSKK